MDEPSERPAGIVIVQHSFAPTWERRPEIHRVKRSSCQHVPIVDSKLEADVEGFLVVGKRRALIQPFFLNSDVAADVRRAHAPDGKFLFGSGGKVEKRFGGGKNSVARSFGDPVIGDVEEANGAAGLAQLLRYLTPPGGFLRVQARNIYNGNLIHHTLPKEYDRSICQGGYCTSFKQVRTRSSGARLPSLDLCIEGGHMPSEFEDRMRKLGAIERGWDVEVILNRLPELSRRGSLSSERVRESLR